MGPSLRTMLDNMRNVWTCIGFMAIFALKGTLAERCFYRKSVYNHLFSTYDKVSAFEECRWGCCDHHSTPCCNVKVSLIIGCIIGGLIGIGLLLITVYCCLVKIKARNNNSTGDNGRGEQRNAHRNDAVVYHTESSQQHADLESSISIYDPPPSYEEVMRGETNRGFKPD